MSLLQIALKNVRHRALNYAAFFLGSSFAVWMLFLYSWLLAHPQMAQVMGSSGSFLRMTQIVTAVFSVFFIAQAQASFVRARQKELGVLTMLGLMPQQLGALLRWESLIIGMGATLLGLIGGNLFARLFGLLFMAILHTGAELPYYFSASATAFCLALFPLVMLLTALSNVRRLKRLPLAEILSGTARPKALPRANRWLSLLGGLLLGGTYAALLFLPDGALSVPGLLLTGVAGTYLCFSQGGVALLGWLRTNRRLMWQPAGLFVIAQMAYKLRDNVGTLFLTSLMTTVVVALSAFNYSVHAAGALGLGHSISFNAQTANFKIVIISFITLLFFLSAGNVLYFRLFTDLEEDRRQFRALHRLGLSVAEIRRIIGIQVAVIFALPGMFAAVTALVIQARIVAAVGPVAFPILGGVLLIYGLLQGTYFAVTRHAYVRRLMSSTAPS
jgi:putative ABC transport system permease protein